jgi:hypothetical protein
MDEAALPEDVVLHTLTGESAHGSSEAHVKPAPPRQTNRVPTFVRAEVAAHLAPALAP